MRNPGTTLIDNNDKSRSDTIDLSDEEMDTDTPNVPSPMNSNDFTIESHIGLDEASADSLYVLYVLY